MTFLRAIALPALLIAAAACRSHGYVGEANRLFSAKKYADTGLMYRKAIQNDPRSAEAYYKLGKHVVNGSKRLMGLDGACV